MRRRCASGIALAALLVLGPRLWPWLDAGARAARRGVRGDRFLRRRYRHRLPADKQRIIFGAFQQADGAANRQYGATCPGLSVSRGLTRLLGAELRLSLRCTCRSPTNWRVRRRLG